MLDILNYTMIVIYFLTSFVLMLYGLNCYVMVFLYKRNERYEIAKRNEILEEFNYESSKGTLPVVTTQLPIFNEYNVVERVIRAVCEMTYPREKHEIQVLDDSTDETKNLVDSIVKEYAEQGYNIKCIRRPNRIGFKAGALDYGMKQSKGEFLAIFDADFVPPADFLLKTVPFFLKNSKVGLVQARWGHLNRKHSLLTRAQSIGIDGHFMIEQSARNGGGLYMNFNGTAGIFRKTAIYDGGGWQWDTLTEDMDLSYRIQFAGWETQYVPELVVPAEIPEDIRAFKSQQFRWAKGSIETALKLFPAIIKSPIPKFKKLQAYFHMTHYMVHPLMLILAFLALPVMKSIDKGPGPILFSFLAILLLFSMIAPSTLYMVSQRASYKNWFSRILFLPFLTIVGTGIALSNTRAVIEALIGYKTEFVRTPKKGDKQQKKYKTKLPISGILEVLLGLYCAFSFHMYLLDERFVVGPFIAIYAAGFLFTGILTLLQSLGFDAS